MRFFCWKGGVPKNPKQVPSLWCDTCAHFGQGRFIPAIYPRSQGAPGMEDSAIRCDYASWNHERRKCILSHRSFWGGGILILLTALPVLMLYRNDSEASPLRRGGLIFQCTMQHSTSLSRGGVTSRVRLCVVSTTTSLPGAGHIMCPIRRADGWRVALCDNFCIWKWKYCNYKKYLCNSITHPHFSSRCV